MDLSGKIRFVAIRSAIVIAVVVALPAFAGTPEARAADLLNAITNWGRKPAERTCCQHAAPASHTAIEASHRAAYDPRQDVRAVEQAPAVVPDIGLHGRPYRIGFGGEDALNEIRLIVCEVKGESDAKSVQAHFLKTAADYREENLCWSFDETLTFGPTSDNRKLVAGWMNYTTGEYGYVFINARGVLDGDGFSWANNNGDAHHVATKGWLTTNWLVVKNPAPDLAGASNFFIGIQMGHEEDDPNVRVAFRAQHLKIE